MKKLLILLMFIAFELVFGISVYAYTGTELSYRYLINKTIRYNNIAVRYIVKDNKKILRKLAGEGPLYACFNNLCTLNISFKEAFGKNPIQEPIIAKILLNKAKHYAIMAFSTASNRQEKIDVSNALSNIYFNVGNKNLYWKYQLLNDKLTQSQHGNPFLLSSIGRDYYELKNYNKAIKYFKLSIPKVKNSSHHYLKISSLQTDYKYLGLIYYHKKKFNIAIRDFKKSYTYYENQYNKHRTYVTDKENAAKLLKLIDKIQN